MGPKSIVEEIGRTRWFGDKDFDDRSSKKLSRGSESLELVARRRRVCRSKRVDSERYRGSGFVGLSKKWRISSSSVSIRDMASSMDEKQRRS